MANKKFITLDNLQTFATDVKATVSELKEKVNSAIFVENTSKPFAPGMTINTGDVITLVVDKSKITEETYDYWETTSSDETFFFFNHGAAASWEYGWNRDSSMVPWDAIDGGYLPEYAGSFNDTYSFIYSGEPCELSVEDTNCDCVKFYIGENSDKAFYIGDTGNKEQLDISMLADRWNLLTPETSVSYEYTGVSIEYESSCDLATPNFLFKFKEGKTYKIESTVKNNNGEDVTLTLDVIDYNNETRYVNSVNLGVDFVSDTELYRTYGIALENGELSVGYSTDYYFESQQFSSNVTISTIENTTEGLASEEYVDQKVAGLASEEYVDQKVANFVDESFVNQKVADLVNSAPETLDTLGELASALKNNADIVDTLNQAIGNKVDKSELSEIVKTTKTINSLALGDTLFKGDTIEFDFNDLANLGNYLYDNGNRLTYSNVYLVNKDTGEGFKFACNLKKISPTDSTNYFIDMQVYFVEGGEIKQFVFEESIQATISFRLGWPPVTVKLPDGTQTNYSFVNNIKDVSNLTYYYEDEHGIHSNSFMPGLGVQKTGAVQDTLVSSKDGVETAVDHYVKVKVDESQPDGRLVEVVGNKEKLLLLNEETDKKINELEDKVKYSDVVNISKFVNPTTNTFYTEDELEGIIPNEGNGSRYVVKTNGGLNYYTYNNIYENAGFIKGNSSFYETTVNGKKLYTSNAVSSVREGSPLRLDKAAKNLASVSFDLHMTGVGQSNRYYPEIALIANEGTRRSVEIQFTCYNASFQLKLLRFGMDTTTLESALPYDTSTNTFDANVKVTVNNAIVTIYLKNDTYLRSGRTYSINLSEVYPTEYDGHESIFSLNLYNLNEVENVYLGLRCDSTPPANWGFSNVVFEKSYWEKGSEIQQDKMYVDLKDKSLYRYTNSTSTKPYSNFERMTSTSVYVGDENKAVYDKDGKTSQLNLSMLSAGQIYTSDSINLEVGQTFYNQEVTFYLNWEGDPDYPGYFPNGYPNGQIEIDNKSDIYWQFETEHPYIRINGTYYYQSEGVSQVTTILNGTITSIVSNQEPLSSVITKVTLKPKTITDLLVRTEDNTFGYVGKDGIKNYLKNEKTIRIYSASSDSAVSFSMQGYSHFQVLSLRYEYATSSDGGTPVRKMRLLSGEASEKNNGSYYFINSDGTLFTSTKTYDLSADKVSLSGFGTSTASKVAYIKLFDAEQV